MTTQLHVVERLRMLGALPPLPPYVFITWYLVKETLQSVSQQVGDIRNGRRGHTTGPQLFPKKLLTHICNPVGSLNLLPQFSEKY
jgi:hypothetical protein